MAIRPNHLFAGVQTVFLVLLCGVLGAQTVPPLVNYQGRLSNPDGSPLTTADYALAFRVFDNTNGGNLIWGPQLFDGTNGLAGHGAKIPVVQGYFNVMLGPVDVLTNSLLNAFNGTNRFVEITVGTNSPILPRQQILAAPFAFQAANAAKLAGYDWGSVFGTNDPVNGKMSGARIANGSITSQQLATSLATNQIWSIGSAPGAIYYGLGNVGIGSTNPASKLQVMGDVNVGGIGQSGTLRIYSDATFSNGSWGQFSADDSHYGRFRFEGGKGVASAENSLAINASLVDGSDNIHPLGTDSNRWGRVRIGTGPSVVEGSLAVGKPTVAAGALDVNGTVTASNFVGQMHSSNLVDATVTQQKLAARPIGTNVGLGGVAISSVVASFDVSYVSGGSTYSNVSALTVTLVTSGRPVLVSLSPGNPADDSKVYFNTSSPASPSGIVAFTRGTNIVARHYVGAGQVSTYWLPPASFWFIDMPPAGTNTFGVSISEQGGGHMVLNNLKLTAFEL